MAIEDLKPEWFCDEHATYARWTLRPRATAQGMTGGRYALWLEIDSAGKTLIGHGYPEAAMYEALDNMDDYALMANVKPIGPHKVLTDTIAELEQLRQRVAELEKERDRIARNL